MTAYERIGEDRLQAVMKDFVARTSSDFIIGFFFAGKDLDRIVEHETALARAHLGGPKAYKGRGIGTAHKPMPINRGHFRRRLALLRTVLQKHNVDDDIIRGWIAHDQRLEDVVTNGVECGPDPTMAYRTEVDP